MTLVAEAAAAPPVVELPTGEFWMGADLENDKFASIVELPRHRVTIARPFAIGVTPVTVGQWNAFAQTKNRDLLPGMSNLPATRVSARDIDDYLEFLTAEFGRPYRLPSEAEWEYACRAMTDTIFSTGDRIDVGQANFLYLDLGGRPGTGRLMPVGSYPPNAFGLFDMHGNVAEIVADDWHNDYAGAPADGTAWRDASRSAVRVVRNGGWDGLPRILRSAFRDWVLDRQRFDNIGFRIACDA
ncbi:MAG: formylglycine-generating enzyme family protein [Tepidisphaeraceae bacterium]